MKKKVITLFCILFLCITGIFITCLFPKAFQQNTWTITQYGPRDINSSFYTIHNPDKGLIVVDGGWTDDADYVREILNSLGNEIDAWILTHPHQDHIGAFNAIYSNLQNIKINNIYTVEMASPEKCKKRASWDSIDTYNDFLNLNIPHIQYLYSGDSLQIFDLTFDIYSTYDDSVKELSHDYLNDGSMMFKVTGPSESFLFCSDVGKSMSDELLERWGENLKADYLQMGHHGYGGLNDDFYQMVQPEIAFFDAPDWLMYDTTGKYDNPEHIKLMESMGADIRSFNTAPNSIVLK